MVFVYFYYIFFFANKVVLPSIVGEISGKEKNWIQSFELLFDLSFWWKSFVGCRLLTCRYLCWVDLLQHTYAAGLAFYLMYQDNRPNGSLYPSLISLAPVNMKINNNLSFWLKLFSSNTYIHICGLTLTHNYYLLISRYINISNTLKVKKAWSM